MSNKNKISDKLNDKIKIWIFAGESSGDTYGAMLANELRNLCPQNKHLLLSGMGGEKMRRAGVEIFVDSSELGVVGLVEVFSKIFTFIKIFCSLVKKAETERPDAIILIDYPGFNIRFAKQMKKRNIPVIWYVSPQVWAWGKSRIRKLAEYCEKMLVIFPFETGVYSKTKLNTVFTGHPLVEIVKKRQDNKIERDPNLVLLLPGSRQTEIKKLLPPILETCAILHSKKPHYKFIVSVNRESILKLCTEIYNSFKAKKLPLPKIEFKCGETEKLIQQASAGLAASGTITVECAIAGLPLVVIYKVNPFTYFLGKIFVSLPYFTMVNIICNELVFREFLQHDVRPEVIANEVALIMPEGERRNYVLRKMSEMVNEISAESQNASVNAAKEIIKTIEEKKCAL